MNFSLFGKHLPFTPHLGEHPPPPPLPVYNPQEEAPKFDWHRIVFHLPRIDRHPDQPLRSGDPAKSDDKPDWRGVIRNNVIPLPEVKPYNIRRDPHPGYFYFDTPDYADPFKKLWFSFKWFFLTGGIMSCVIGIIQHRRNTFADNSYLVTTFLLPWMFGGMVASTSAITIANLRGNKDDLLNYVGAGIVAGAATGRQSYLHHFRHTIFWMTTATWAKYNAEINGHLSPHVNPYFQSYAMSGLSAHDGVKSGDFSFFARRHGDPGRDTKGLTLG